MKPDRLPLWTDGDAAKIQEPSTAKKELGYVGGEKPNPFQMNWLFHYNGLWIEYFDAQLDAVQSLKNSYDAVVGTDGTHADINAVMADMDGNTLPTQDVRIFVKDPLTLTTTQVIDKEGVEIKFHPRALIGKGTATTALRVDAARCKIFESRFVNFSTAGDKAIELTANANLAMIHNNTFLNCDTQIDVDNSLNNVSLVANLEE